MSETFQKLEESILNIQDILNKREKVEAIFLQYIQNLTEYNEKVSV